MNFKLRFLAFSFSLFTFIASSANAIPTADDINILAKRAKLTADTFMQESFELRMKYEYSGRFLQQNDKENLHKLAKNASKQLQAITKAQKELKNKIEDYEDDDWDDKYGTTGLWRKLSGDFYVTTLTKCEIDFYLALSSQQPQRNKISQDILAQIDSLNQIHKTAYSQFLKAKILTLLARTGPAYKPLAKKEFDWLMVRSDMRHSTVFRIAIERIKLLGQTEPGQLDKLAGAIAKSDCSDDIELVLSLAFLQRRYDPAGFEKTIGLFPETQDFLGTVILSDISGRIVQQKDLEQISVFEAELATQVIWKNKPKDYETVLNHLASAEKFQTPLILYVTAITFTNSSPIKAVNLLIKASRLQSALGGQKSEKLDIEPYKIAGQAAQLAYNLFIKDPGHCRLALEAFDNYSTIANEKMDAESQYIYSFILQREGQAEKSKKILQKLAQKSSGYWSSRAKLDLIEQTIEQKQEESQSIPNELFIKLKNLISECSKQNKESNQLRIKAITIYCQLLLESREKGSAQKVLSILAEAETARDPNLNVFKSRALRQLGRLSESAECLLSAIDHNNCENTGEAMELLTQLVGRIDGVITNVSNSIAVSLDCKKLAEYCYHCLGTQESGLYLTETAIFAADKNEEKLSAIDKLLDNLAQNGDADNVDLLRCRARLLTEQGKFEEAAELWVQVANIRKSDTPSAHQRSWKWWRAKFYELDCWAKCPQTQKMSVLHTIEVLENSFRDIPPLWAEKLSSLKQQCRSQPR